MYNITCILFLKVNWILNKFIIKNNSVKNVET